MCSEKRVDSVLGICRRQPIDCPDVISLVLDEHLAPAWASGGGRFTFRLPWVAAWDGGSEPLAWFELAAGRRVPAVTRAGDRIVLHFDPEAAIRFLLEERYYQPVVPVHTRFPIHHHYLPGQLRVAAAQLITSWQRRRDRGAHFPTWPIVPGVELLRAVVAGAERMAGWRDAPVALWPDGKRFAVALTHDVDTAQGLRQAERFARIEHDAGVVSAWYVVPRRFQLDHAVLQALAGAGHEIGCHGYDHRNRTPFLPRAAISARLEECRPFLEDYAVQGYRSPGLLRTSALYAELSARFVYDTSAPDTEWYTGIAPYNGCCTVLPFWRGQLLILPVTLPLDALLIHYGLAPRKILELWRAKIDWIARVGGLAVITTHTELQYSANPAMLAVYRELLTELTGRHEAWLTRPADIASWWLASGADPLASIAILNQS
jgi:peptidoglycan/xylan/chitin deacetylase (PgdA/CDA1 family)